MSDAERILAYLICKLEQAEERRARVLLTETALYAYVIVHPGTSERNLNDYLELRRQKRVRDGVG